MFKVCSKIDQTHIASGEAIDFDVTLECSFNVTVSVLQPFRPKELLDDFREQEIDPVQHPYARLKAIVWRKR